MLELCIYKLENGAIPPWVKDGGHFPWEETLIGVCKGAPDGVERITEWELKSRLLAHHAVTTFIDENGDDMTTGEVETLAANFYSAKIGASTWDHVRAYRNRLLSTADERIMRWDEQTALGLTPDDNGISYTAYNTTTYSDKNALLWYKQDLRDITDNYGTVSTVVWPDLPA